MKKLLLFSMIISVNYYAFAQKINMDKVPAIVKASFQNKYPAVVAKWEKEHGNYEANFKENDNTVSVLIEPGGKITETEKQVSVAALPATVHTYITAHYPGKKITEAAMISKADGTVIYEAELGKIDLTFDATGKFLKQTKD